jgi:hypothetical protein
VVNVEPPLSGVFLTNARKFGDVSLNNSIRLEPARL